MPGRCLDPPVRPSYSGHLEPEEPQGLQGCSVTLAARGPALWLGAASCFLLLPEFRLHNVQFPNNGSDNEQKTGDQTK